MSCFSCTCGLGGVELQTPDPARRGQAPAVWCPLRAQGAPGPPEPICTRLTSFAAAWEPAALDAVFPSAWAWATLTSQPTSLDTRGADHRPGVLGGAGGRPGLREEILCFALPGSSHSDVAAGRERRLVTPQAADTAGFSSWSEGLE